MSAFHSKRTLRASVFIQERLVSIGMIRRGGPQVSLAQRLIAALEASTQPFEPRLTRRSPGRNIGSNLSTRPLAAKFVSADDGRSGVSADRNEAGRQRG